MGFGGSFVLDSSHVIGALRILQFIKERRERKEQREAKLEELKQASDAKNRRLNFALKKPESKSQNILPIHLPKGTEISDQPSVRQASDNHLPKF